MLHSSFFSRFFQEQCPQFRLLFTRVSPDCLFFCLVTLVCVCVCVRVIQELQAKGGLTDKEKKELKRLKAEEMCEMLGRGC